MILIHYDVNENDEDEDDDDEDDDDEDEDDDDEDDRPRLLPAAHLAGSVSCCSSFISVCLTQFLLMSKSSDQ